MAALKRFSTVVAMCAFASTATAMPTWEYNADSGNLPNAAGEPLEGGAATTSGASIVDLGGGDLVLRIDTQDIDTSTYFEQADNANPGAEWDVNPTVGYSIEWNVRLDSVEATTGGAADLIFADGVTFTSLRLSRPANGGAVTAAIKSGLNNTILGSVTVADPDAFHTFRIDKINNSVDLFIDGVRVLDNVVDPVAGPYDLIRFGDGTGALDGNHDTQFLRTYQSGVIPEPASLGLIGLGGLMLIRRRGA